MLKAFILLVLGASLTFAFAPYNLWYLPFLVLPVAIFLLKDAQRPFLYAWCFGIGYFGAGLSWVHVCIVTFGGVPIVVSILLMFILCGYLALFTALLFKLLHRCCLPRLWPLFLPFSWFAMEWLRGRIFTGFPWLSIAYSQSQSPLQSWFPIIGEVGLSVLIIFVSSIIAYSLYSKKFSYSLSTMLTLCAATFITHLIDPVKPTDASRSVALVQGNIEQSIKWQPEKDQSIIDKYIELSEPYWDHDLVIWPEAAIPRFEHLASPELLWLNQKAIKSNTGFITGIVDYNPETYRAYNSVLALGIDARGNEQSYQYKHSNRFDKHHLLPIGEFVPLGNFLRRLAPIFNLPQSSFSRGNYKQDDLSAGGIRLSTAICFEIVFSKQIRDNLKKDSDVILTVSNDAWFGDSHGPHQHLQIAQVRALEYGLPLIRATNNGITAIVDHNGKIIARAPQFQEQVLSAELSLTDGQTWYRRTGDWPILVLAFILFIYGYFRQRTNIS